MGVCAKPWPPKYPTKQKKGQDVPIHPPCIFSSPESCRAKTTASYMCGIRRGDWILKAEQVAVREEEMKMINL